MSVGAVVDIESNGTVCVGAALQIGDDQHGSRGVADEQFGPAAGEVDAHPGPLRRLEIHIGLVAGWRLAPQPIEIIAGIGKVLRRMIASYLIVGAAVGGTEINSLAGEAPVRLGDRKSTRLNSSHMSI